MLYSKRTVKCSALKRTREAAYKSLEAQYSDAEVLDFKREGDKWVATLLEKHADFPPKDEGDDPAPFKDEGSEDSENSAAPEAPSDSEGDGPPEGDKKPKEKGEKAEIGLLTDLVMQIADKLGIVPGGESGVPGAEDAPIPPGPPGLPPGPPGVVDPHAGQKEVLHRTKLGPGEVPPGGTPIGAPSFSLTNPDLSRLASFDAFCDDVPNKSIKQAKDELDAQFGPQGFKVRQIKRVENGTRIAAKLSRR